MGILEDIWAFLEQIQSDPYAYSVIFFIYAIAAAVILPIPVEAGLLLCPAMPFVVKALILGTGKAVGSVLVFYIGVNIEGPIRKYSTKWKWYKALVDACERFVMKFSYVGLYVILSIPIMVDTIPIYLFSIFNKEGQVMQLKYFALVNFLAGVTRAIILLAFLELFGLNFFDL